MLTTPLTGAANPIALAMFLGGYQQISARFGRVVRLDDVQKSIRTAGRRKREHRQDLWR
jgi:hypothetical protein